MQLSLVLVFIATLMQGCVSVDTKASKEVIQKEATAKIDAKFSNRARYWSRGEFVASDNFSDALSVPAIQADRVNISINESKELIVYFTRDDLEIYKKTYALGTEYQINELGAIEIKVGEGGCGGRDSPGFGCGAAKTVTMFINATNDLAVIESGGGVGVIGIIPFALYSKQLAIYPSRN
jgi:hypothetical protein